MKAFRSAKRSPHICCMLCFPNAKINIGLQVHSKREDGYHNIRSIFYPVYRIHDALEIVPASDKDRDEFKYGGLPIPGNQDLNMVYRALKLIRKNFEIPPLKVHLYKNIPMGSGVGGGSSNGTFLLKMLNTKFSLGISQMDLLAMAEDLGSDCPFFIENKPMSVSGRGEVLEAIDFSLKGKFLAIVFPGVHVSTAEAYKGIIPESGRNSPGEIISNFSIDKWRDHLENDFEEYVFRKEPEIGEIKKQLYKYGALYASMSGSGSSVFGIFNDKPSLEGLLDSMDLRVVEL